MSNNEVEFTIKVKMNERWVDDFCSMLKYMENCGKIGHSSLVGFYADGDGDFRPKFEIDKDYNIVKGYKQQDSKHLPEIIFDAG